MPPARAAATAAPLRLSAGCALHSRHRRTDLQHAAHPLPAARAASPRYPRPPFPRRQFFRLSASTLALGCGLLPLFACRKEASPAIVCTDTTGLSPEQIALRRQAAYVDHSPQASQACGNCHLYRAALPGHCGRCTAFDGSVHPQGWCTLWEKASLFPRKRPS